MPRLYLNALIESIVGCKRESPVANEDVIVAVGGTADKDFTMPLGN